MSNNWYTARVLCLLAATRVGVELVCDTSSTPICTQYNNCSCSAS
jgi:hypothetical protein